MAGCGGQGTSPLAALQSLPENTLAYPGSVILGTISLEATVTIDGPSNAVSGHLFGASASETDIVSFYNGKLAKTGWLPTSLNAQPSSIETSALAWWKDHIVLRLSFLMHGNDPRLPSVADQAQFKTIFRVQLIDHTSDGLGPYSS